MQESFQPETPPSFILNCDMHKLSGYVHNSNYHELPGSHALLRLGHRPQDNLPLKSALVKVPFSKVRELLEERMLRECIDLPLEEDELSPHNSSEYSSTEKDITFIDEPEQSSVSRKRANELLSEDEAPSKIVRSQPSSSRNLSKQFQAIALEQQQLNEELLSTDDEEEKEDTSKNRNTENVLEAASPDKFSRHKLLQMQKLRTRSDDDPDKNEQEEQRPSTSKLNKESKNINLSMVKTYGKPFPDMGTAKQVLDRLLPAFATKLFPYDLSKMKKPDVEEK